MLLWQEPCAVELVKYVETVAVEFVKYVESVEYVEYVESVKHVESVGLGCDEELEGKLERSEPSLLCL